MVDNNELTVGKKSDPVPRFYAIFSRHLRENEFVEARALIEKGVLSIGTGWQILANAELAFRDNPTPDTLDFLHSAARSIEIPASVAGLSALRAYDYLLGRGRAADAAAWSERLLSMAPNAALVERVVGLLRREGQWVTLLDVVARAGDVLTEKRASDLSLQAQLALGDLDGATTSLDRLLALNPTDAELITRKMRLLVRRGKERDAFDIAVAALDSGITVPTELAITAARRADVPATELLSFCRRHIPCHSIVPRLCSIVFGQFARDRRNIEALALAREQIARDPSIEWAWVGAANMLIRLEDDAGQAALTAELMRTGSISDSLRVRTLLELNAYSEAAEYLQRPGILDGANDGFYEAVAQAAMHQGDYSTARVATEDVPRATPWLASMSVTLAAAKRLLGRDPASGPDLLLLTSALVPFEQAYFPRPGSVLHLGGSLSTGGAERQMVLTATAHYQDWTNELALMSTDDHRNGLVELLEGSGTPRLAIKGDANAKRLRELMISDQRHIEAVMRLGALPPTLAADAMACYAMIVARAPQVVHCWQDGMNLRAGLAAVAAGAPRIILSGRHSFRPSWRKRFPMMMPLLAGLLGREGVTMECNSRFGADVLVEALGVDPGRVGVIPNGYDATRSDMIVAISPSVEALRSQAGFGSDHIVIGNVARLVPVKRQDLWLRMLAALISTNPQVRGLLVGDGMLDQQLQELAEELGIADRVFFAGRQSPVEPWMAAMDLFVYTGAADGDGMPNVLIEAQAVGCPVASVPAGGSLETFVPGKTGVVLTAAGPDGWADELQSLVRSPERLRQMGADAHRHVRDELGIERLAANTAAVWKATP